ncbi:hypothetical protein BLS_005431 [Venturia inaequalis]|uniref:F-box domain-containing protein n=1 Tax=Venturia inaequalis TaxID=5025 RepID=A0A8H3UGW6_VENIN|nr:hypothetical protein BLS_005431 [Venturia inaequalis]KAE9974918.1 hypothetical protein EG327_008622 [Venturia inaequalis]KAE9982033.1 hypothetical protein EG328_011275 [Venturia inaequalis]RDI77815.1 hypothetical protein Vi05172_g12217 [Venturia inaequalis]
MSAYRDQPFSLEIAFERHDVQSHSALFQLPFEILSSIFELIPDESFDKLSTINSDFYLIARSRQFATVDFRYSQRTLFLIQRLLIEVPGHETNLPKLPFFGHCVRNASAAVIRSKQMIKFDRNDWDAQISLEPEELHDHKARSFNFEEQIEALHRYLGTLIRLVLGNLENFLWLPATHFKLNQCFLESLVNSSIKGLSFGEFSLDDDLLESDDRLLQMKTRNLERLQLGLGAITFPNNVQITYSFILAHLGPTIRRLDLHLTKFSSLRMSLTSKVDLPRLEELRLSLQAPGVVSTSFLTALFSTGANCHIQSLYVSLKGDAVAKEFFKKHGHMANLKSLVWDDDDEQISMAVLRANPQLRKVNIAPGLGRYLPILVTTFQQLTTLSVVFVKRSSMVPATFDTIGRITTLENLRIGLEEQESDFSQQYWVADHNTIRNSFSRLHSLRLLSFEFDTYHLHEVFDRHRYYRDMILLVQVQALPITNSTTHMDPSQWELEHKHRMTLAADSYFQEHPDLNFIYLGQLAVRREIWSGAVTCSQTRGRAPNTLTLVFRYSE